MYSLISTTFLKFTYFPCFLIAREYVHSPERGRETERARGESTTPKGHAHVEITYISLIFGIFGMLAHVLGMFPKPLSFELELCHQPCGIWQP